jgi:hypothetical protein
MLAEATVVGRGNNLQVQHGTDNNLLVRFYFNKIGECPYVKINVAGDNKTEWDRPVKDDDKLRWADKWKAYESQQNQYVGEVLLGACDLFDENKVQKYHAFNIHTVDQLAKLNDAFITQIGMGTREDVKRANAYLSTLSEKAKEEHLLKELQMRDERLAQLEALVAQLQASSQQASQTAKPGKPKEN